MGELHDTVLAHLMNIRTLPNIQRDFLATSTTEVFYPMTPWYPTLEAAFLLGTVLALISKGSGNFQCHLGIQTAPTDTDVPAAAVNPTSAATQVAAVSKTYLRFDPNGATEGNIDAAVSFRVGVFVSLSAGTTPCVGTVALQSLSWR
jgi:hypothetical protein